MISNNGLKQLFLLLFILGLASLLCTNLVFMLDAILGAIILAILSVKPIEFLVKRKIKPANAEWIYFLGSITIILTLLTSVFFIAKNHFHSVIDFAAKYKDSIEVIGSSVNEKIGIQIINGDFLKTIALKVSSFIPTILNSTLDIFTTLGVMYFLLYFFIKEGTALRSGVLSLLPVSAGNRETLFDLIYQSILSNAVMMPVVAFVQAILAWISYIIVDTSNSFIWFIATFFLAMLPFFGAALVYIPLGVLTFIHGYHASGIFIILWGISVVSSSDNVLRIYLMKKFDDTHPLVTFLGVLAGLNIFGFLGIIFGPLLISLLLILVKIYKEEYGTNDEIVLEEEVVQSI
jgi:predicted PurR-regulated permease PerM